MKSFCKKLVVALLLCAASSVLFAQEKTQSYYNSHESEILPDAREAFASGNYERTIELCLWHYIIVGDEAADSLRDRAERCAKLLEEMNTLFGAGNTDEARNTANSLISINPNDPAAKKVLEVLIESEKLQPQEVPVPPIVDTLTTIVNDPINDVVEERPIYAPAQAIGSETNIPKTPTVPVKTSNFLALFNLGYSLDSGLNAGLTFGQIGKIGWYGKVMSTFAVPQSTSYECDENGSISGVMPAYSGMASKSKAYVVAGVTVGVGGHIYLQAGAGYGYRMYDWELLDGGWVRNAPGSYSGLAIDAGMLACVNRLVISAGATYLCSSFDFSVGIGFMF